MAKVTVDAVFALKVIDKCKNVFVPGINEFVAEHNNKTWKNSIPRAIEIKMETGSRYVKIWTYENGKKYSIFGFVDLANGNILKANSTKTCHPTPRGNVFVNDGLGSYGPYGINYIR